MTREIIPYWKNISIASLEGEEWKEISGYEGLYEVSNLGRIKSINRVVPHKTSHNKTISERILVISKDSQGYLLAALWKKNISFRGLVHRLVAMAFIENPENFPEVNHKFGNKEDNRPSELNWSTASDNQKHSYEILGRKGASYGKFGANNKRSKKVKCTTLDITFDSFGIAAKELGVSQSAISFVCLGNRSHTHGLVFKYI